MAQSQPPMAGRVDAPPQAPPAPPPAAPPMAPPAPPAMPVRAPPAGAVPAPAAPAAPAGFEPPAPPPRPQINVAERYGEIATIRILAMIFMFIAASLSILHSILSVGGVQALSIVGIVLTVLGIVCGFLAIINQKNRKMNNLTTIGAVAFLIAGAAARPPLLALGTLSLGSADFILALMFAIFFLLFLEYTHGVRRFWEIGEMAIEKNLREFDFGHVLRQYIVMGFVWLGVIIGITMAVVAIQYGFVSLLPDQLGRSAEMNSVYGLAIAEGLMFAIVAVVVIILMKVLRGDFTSMKAPVRAAAPTGPAMPGAQVYVPGRSPQQTGLSSTAPPPRAQ